MNVIKAARDYIGKMCDEVSGMKVLLLDAQTTTIVSMVYSQTEILQKEVFLVDRLDKKGREKLQHLKAVVFVRPTIESVQALVDELRDPRYKEYHIFFNNIARTVYIERLAEADQQAVVIQVQEYFADYIAVNPDVFSLQMTGIIGDHLQSWDSSKFDRSTEALISALLSLKKKPLIRYEKNSDMAKRLANELNVVHPSHPIPSHSSIPPRRIPSPSPSLPPSSSTSCSRRTSSLSSSSLIPLPCCSFWTGGMTLSPLC